MEEHLDLRDDGGFTLTEVLVTLAITGIIAAIAVPLFINQRRQAVDDLTVRSVVMSGEALERAAQDFPAASANQYKLSKTGTQVMVYLDLNKDGKLQEDAEPFERVNLEGAEDIQLKVLSTHAGSFTIYGWSGKGREYTQNTKAAAYDSASSGFVRGVHDSRYDLP